jgi:hypothetical protein
MRHITMTGSEQNNLEPYYLPYSSPLDAIFELSKAKRINSTSVHEFFSTQINLKIAPACRVAAETKPSCVTKCLCKLVTSHISCLDWLSFNHNGDKYGR